MCGICGYINFKKPIKYPIIEKMSKTLSHRGPNDMGTYNQVFEEYEIALGHVRLSILDLSEQGHQPMCFHNNTIVFNGEIYNYKEIRDELIKLGHTFSSNCDTEVVLHAYTEWGVESVKRFIGMFAFAVYDHESKIITLCRDRAGIKPLYYYHDGSCFLWGSELKAFHAYPYFEKEICKDAVALYMKHGYIPAPYSIFEKTYKLQQGHYLIFDLKSNQVTINQYWNLHDYYIAPKFDIGYEEAKQQVEDILKSSFNYRMISDVPVGVFLSAGFDSSCVAALLQSTTSNRIKTFTIGFESGVNEAPRAKVIADYLGTDHTEYYCTIREGLELVDQLPYYYDEPFADSSAIPTTLVSKLASKDVKVVLSADGGDEIFAGYNNYETLIKRYNQIQKIPQGIYNPLSGILSFMSRYSGNQHIAWRLDFLSKTLHNGKDDLQMSFLKNFYKTDFSGYQGNMFSFENIPEPPVLLEEMHEMDFLSKLMYIDYIQYMCDDILVKVDRATMSVSIEGRDPFLDQRIIEFVARIPSNYKYDGKVRKKILKDVVYKYLPKDIMNMPKNGFSLPLADWLQNGLSYYVDHYLSTYAISKSAIFNIDYISFCKEQFIKDPSMNAYSIWKILQFQMWFDKWMTSC